jgi:hypothetical protein
MACREREQRRTPHSEIGLRRDEQRADLLLKQRREAGFDIALRRHMLDQECPAERSGGGLRIAHVGFGVRIDLRGEHSDRCVAGCNIAEKLEAFGHQRIGQEGDPGDIAAGPVDARNKTHCHRIDAGDKDDGNGCRRGFGGRCRWCGVREDDVDAALHEFGRQRRQARILAIGVPVLERNIAADNEAGFAQPLLDRCEPGGFRFLCLAVQHADHRQGGLLCVRRERQDEV